MEQVRLVLVGGFLGAGKTTLLAQAAQRLLRQHKRVGLITNDQAADLVDTRILEDAGFGVSEIAGGCFCCRFENLVASASHLIEAVRPDVLIGEPVGSCTDLSATVLQPLKKLYPHRFRIAPFSVLADPQRLRECLDSGRASTLPDSVMYVVRKQLEEADLLVLNKADLLAPAELAELKAATADQIHDTPVLVLSALTGEGVDEWLDFVLGGERAGRRIAKVDYDTYAEGEAVLGWLNATVRLHAQGRADWSAFSLRLLEGMQRELRARPAEIAHVKLHLSTAAGSLVASVTSTRARPSLRGAAPGEAEAAHLTLNARVHVGPDDLRQVVERCLRAVAGEGIQADVLSIRSFSPARPQPTHRFETVV